VQHNFQMSIRILSDPGARSCPQKPSTCTISNAVFQRMHSLQLAQELPRLTYIYSTSTMQQNRSAFQWVALLSICFRALKYKTSSKCALDPVLMQELTTSAGAT
jgi:hypothetical protein